MEDDDEICELLAEVITLHGYTGLGARSVHHALDLLRRGLRPRVVVLDPLSRDNVNHHLAELTSDPAWDHTPVILGRGEEGAPSANGVLRRHYLPKPFVVQELLDALERYLGPVSSHRQPIQPLLASATTVRRKSWRRVKRIPRQPVVIDVRPSVTVPAAQEGVSAASSLAVWTRGR